MSHWLSESWEWLRIRVVFSRTLVFIWGFILCCGFIKIGVVGVLMDYLSELFGDTLWKAAIMTNVKDGLSSIFVVVAHVLVSYVGRFNVIIFCTSSSIIGLILLWVSSDHLRNSESIFPVYVVYPAVILIAFGEVMNSTLRDFLDYQLKQKVKQRTETDHTESQQKQNVEKVGEQNVDHAFIWWHSAFLIGSLIATFLFGKINDWSKQFNIAILFMVAAYVWFYSGCLTYRFEEQSGSHRYKILRVFKAALWKVNVRYPTSEEQYYWKNLTNKEFYCKRTRQILLKPHVPSLWRWLIKAPIIEDPSSNTDTERQEINGELCQIRLKPHVPSLWRWLDKAAIIKDTSSNTDLERQEINGKLCPVEEVREVKLVISMTHFALALLPCSLLMAAANTFFIEQANKLKHASYLSGLLVINFFIRELVVVLFGWFKLEQQRTTILRIGIGIICAVLCCFTAWRVELHILSLVNSDKNLSIAILIPQYCLLGLTDGLACKGFERFFCNHVPESMGSFGDAFVQLVLGIGIWLSILFIYFIDWFQDSIDDSHVDRYYFLLGILNIVGLLIYGYYFWNYSYKNGNAEGEESTTEEIELSENLHEEGQEQADNALEETEQVLEIEESIMGEIELSENLHEEGQEQVD